VDAVERTTQLVVDQGPLYVIAGIMLSFLVSVLALGIWAATHTVRAQNNLTGQLLARVLRGEDHEGKETGEPGLRQVAATLTNLSVQFTALAADLRDLNARLTALEAQRARDMFVFASTSERDRALAASLRQEDLTEAAEARAVEHQAAAVIRTEDAIAMSDVVRQVALLVEQVSALVIQIAGLPCQQAQACPANAQMEG
jgi:hypothetical protein